MRFASIFALVSAAVPFVAHAQSCKSAWEQCGGVNYSGAKCCVDGYTCTAYNDYYSQCVPGSSPTTTPTPTSTTTAPTPTKTTAAPTPEPTSEAPTVEPTAEPTSAPTSEPTSDAPSPTTTSSPSRLHPALPIKYCTSSGCTTKATQVVLDGKDFKVSSAADYPANGVSITGNSMKLTLKNGSGPRVYLVSPNDNKYEMIQMVSKEISYDIDTSELTCGMNGAFYFVQMPETGAATGAGYCDANGVGGSNCEEMDIWEANSHANAFTIHPTSHDSGGCGLNGYKDGHHDWYGTGSSFKVDSTKPFTIVTQFFTDSTVSVNAIRRLYLQNGKTILGGTMNPYMCDAAAMYKPMRAGSVLAMSVWKGGMGWLDSGRCGPCPVGQALNDATVTFSNIRIGDIGTTATGTNVAFVANVNTTVLPKLSQCGGAEYDGSNTCVSGTKCVKQNEYSWQCQ